MAAHTSAGMAAAARRSTSRLLVALSVLLPLAVAATPVTARYHHAMEHAVPSTSSSPWSCLGQGPRRAGTSTVTGPTTAVKPRWRAHVNVSAAASAASLAPIVVVTPHQPLVVIATAEAVVALDGATGGIHWSLPTHGSAAPPCVAAANVVVFAVAGAVVSVNGTTGVQLWTTSLPAGATGTSCVRRAPFATVLSERPLFHFWRTPCLSPLVLSSRQRYGNCVSTVLCCVWHASWGACVALSR